MRAMVYIIQSSTTIQKEPGQTDENAAWAIDTLEKKHAANPELKEIIGEMRFAGMMLPGIGTRLVRPFAAAVMLSGS